MRNARIVTAAIATALVLSALAGCGDEGGRSPGSTAAAPPDPPAPQAPAPQGDAGSGPAEAERPDDGRPADSSPQPEPDPRDDAAAKRIELRAAQRAYEDYVDAINAGDGARLCRLLPPDALRDLRPAVASGGCAHRIGASIGYRDPRGLPVWEKTTLSGFERAAISRDLVTARLTAAIVTSFADRTEPSVESDVAYLERVGGEWRLAKPTGALYRAIGQADIPPSVISPP